MANKKKSIFHVWLCRWLRLLPPRALVADLQYAKSRNLAMFRRAGFCTIGIESHGACKERPLVDSGNTLPLLPHSIDGVWAAQWADMPGENFVFALQELLRIVRPGGLVFFAIERQKKNDAGTAYDWGNSPAEMGKLLEVMGSSCYLCDENKEGERSWIVALMRAPLKLRNADEQEIPHTPLTLQAALLWGKMSLDPLENNGTVESEELLCSLLAVDKATLYANPERALAFLEDEQFLAMLAKRKSHQPLAYLTGRQGFMSLEFSVTPDVLIPRPETELIAEYVIAHYRDRPCFGLDLGTGSGCLAVSILHYLPQSWFAAIDICGKALDVARRNSIAHGVAERLSLLQGDLFRPLSASAQFDVIVSNPPYISEQEYGQLMPEVKCEPRIALVAGDGLEFYRRIVADTASYLKPGGAMLLELGYGQSEQVRALLPASLKIQEVIADHAGIPRVLVCNRRD